MSDGIHDAHRRVDEFNKARKLTCMYFGVIPFEEGITPSCIKEFLSEFDRTPEKMKWELENLGMFWWLDNCY